MRVKIGAGRNSIRRGNIVIELKNVQRIKNMEESALRRLKMPLKGYLVEKRVKILACFYCL